MKGSSRRIGLVMHDRLVFLFNPICVTCDRADSVEVC